jgi:ankyrin repeat protein
MTCLNLFPSQKGETALHLACARGAVGVVSELLAAGAQIEARAKVSDLVSCECLSQQLTVFTLSTLSLQSGWTPLHHACFKGHLEVVTVLLSAGASIEVQTKVRSDEGSTRVEFNHLFRMDGLPFTLLVIMVLWEWSLSCWQQALKSNLEIG